MTFALHLRRFWATLTGRDHLALQLTKEILMADFTALDTLIARAVAKSNSDDAALAAAAADKAAIAGEIDRRVQTLAQTFPEVTPAPAIDPATGQPVA